MKRSSDSPTRPTQPDPTHPTDRRALLLHPNAALLAHPRVAAFLNHHNPAELDYRSLECKFVRANEPGLLLELIRDVRPAAVQLLQTNNLTDGVPILAEGLWETVVDHVPEMPWVQSLLVAGASFTAQGCARLQAALNHPACRLRSLALLNCGFADAQVRFPPSAPSLTRLEWTQDRADDDNPPSDPALGRLLEALSGWSALEAVSLASLGACLDHAAIARLLLSHPGITELSLLSDQAPAPAHDPAHRPEHDPVLLLAALRGDRTGVTRLSLDLSDVNDSAFNDRCLLAVADCLVHNTTLESLELPGIRVCTEAARQQFGERLQHSQALTSLEPLDAFDLLMNNPVLRNRKRQLWFTPGFILGAAEAFVQLMGAPRDLGVQLAQNLASTPAERLCAGSVMALLCRSTHEGAIRLRSAGLLEALRLHLQGDQPQRCLELVHAMVHARMDLLPPDRAQLLALARGLDRTACLPPGYGT